MTKEFANDPFVGEIGGNIPKNKEEMEEDLLEFFKIIHGVYNFLRISFDAL